MLMSETDTHARAHDTTQRTVQMSLYTTRPGREAHTHSRKWMMTIEDDRVETRLEEPKDTK